MKKSIRKSFFFRVLIKNEVKIIGISSLTFKQVNFFINRKKLYLVMKFDST